MPEGGGNLAMNLRQADNVLHRYLVTGRPLDKAPRLVRRALAIAERKEQAENGKLSRAEFLTALEVYDEVRGKADAYRKRAAVRLRLANYIERDVLSQHWDLRRYTLAEKLRNARRTGTYGRRPNGDLVTIWDDKSGLARLDPDEAREESQRLSERYGAHMVKLAGEGRGLHYLVLTVPNVAPGELAAGQKAIYRKWVNFLRKQSKKDQVFAEIAGSIAILEAPLSAHDNWNIHLNVLMVTQRKFHAGLYEKIRREWKFNVELRPVKGDPGEVARAFTELLKYGARAVPEKSNDKASRHTSDAPAMIEWPASRFIEWDNAQQGFRRTRTYGCLYGNKVPKPEPQSNDDVVWLGGLFLSPDRFTVALPLIDLIPGDRSTTERRRPPTTGPP